MQLSKISKLVISIIIPLLVGAVSSIFTTSSISSWYSFLSKPVFNPPNYIFFPVWTILYVLMGISLFLIWDSESKYKKTAITFFIIQLSLNFLWSLLFFGLRNPFLAFIEIILLWIFILLSIISFYKISKTSAYLLIPYILWVSFALILNFYIWQLNLV